MSEAPERIWVLRNFHNQVLAVFDVDVDEPIKGRDDVEYVRADRIEELEAANRGLVRLNEATEARAKIAEAKMAKAVEALTPSGDTKAAYIGEFSFPQTAWDENEVEVTVKTYVPWTTIKEIMRAIHDRATIAELTGETE